MLTLDDCLAFCELSEEEIAAIADHEHLPMIVAAELGNHLLQGPGGALRIKRIILDNVATAGHVRDRARAVMLKLVLRRFVERHPECRYRSPASRRAVRATVRRFLEVNRPAS